MFKITQGKGFFMQFENGYSISVQWGFANYCNNRSEEIDWEDYPAGQRRLGEQGSNTAEIAIMDRYKNFCGQELGIFEGDDVEGYCTPERVLEVMNIIAELDKFS